MSKHCNMCPVTIPDGHSHQLASICSHLCVGSFDNPHTELWKVQSHGIPWLQLPDPMLGRVGGRAALPARAAVGSAVRDQDKGQCKRQAAGEPYQPRLGQCFFCLCEPTWSWTWAGLALLGMLLHHAHVARVQRRHRRERAGQHCRPDKTQHGLHYGVTWHFAHRYEPAPHTQTAGCDCACLAGVCHPHGVCPVSSEAGAAVRGRPTTCRSKQHHAHSRHASPWQRTHGLTAPCHAINTTSANWLWDHWLYTLSDGHLSADLVLAVVPIRSPGWDCAAAPYTSLPLPAVKPTQLPHSLLPLRSSTSSQTATSRSPPTCLTSCVPQCPRWTWMMCSR